MLCKKLYYMWVFYEQRASISESHIDVLVEVCDCGLQVLHGYQHVLDHVMLLIQASDGFSLGELQQRDFRRNHPAKEPPEHWIVAEWNDVLEKRHR